MLACRAPPDAAPSMPLQCEPSLAQQIAPNWPQFQSGISWHLVPRPVHKTRNQSQGTGLMCSPIASKTCSTWQPFRACADKYSMMTSSQIKHQGMSKGGTHRRSKKTLGCCGCRRKLVWFCSPTFYLCFLCAPVPRWVDPSTLLMLLGALSAKFPPHQSWQNANHSLKTTMWERKAISMFDLQLQGQFSALVKCSHACMILLFSFRPSDALAIWAKEAAFLLQHASTVQGPMPLLWALKAVRLCSTALFASLTLFQSIHLHPKLKRRQFGTHIPRDFNPLPNSSIWGSCPRYLHAAGLDTAGCGKKRKKNC